MKSHASDLPEGLPASDVADEVSDLCDTAAITNSTQTYTLELLQMGASMARSTQEDVEQIIEDARNRAANRASSPETAADEAVSPTSAAASSPPLMGETKRQIKARFGTSMNVGSNGGCLWQASDGTWYEVLFGLDGENGCFADEDSVASTVHEVGAE